MEIATKQFNTPSMIAGEDFYQGFSSLRDTIVSFQYDDNEFLTFRVSQAKEGAIVGSGTYTASLRCKIGERTYTFNHQHFDQMTHRECKELFNKLGVDGNQLL